MSARHRKYAIASFVLAVVCTASYWGVSSRAFAGDCDSVTPITGADIPSRFLGVGAVIGGIQDNPTGFGDVAPPSQEPTEGNELDQLFVTNDVTNLYIGITGNTPRTDDLQNTVLVFIDTDAGAIPTTLDTAGCCADNTDLIGFPCGNMPCETCVAALSISCDVNQSFYEWSDTCQAIAMNECALDCSCELGDPAVKSNALREVDGLRLDFDPDYAVAIWNENGVQNGVLFDLSLPADSAGLALVAGSGMDFVVNNENLGGVDAEAANDPLQQQANALSATTGFEITLPLATLGVVETDEINMQAIIVSGIGGTISNQSLPPLNRTDLGVIPPTGGTVQNPGDPSPANPVDFTNDTLPSDEFFPGFPGLQHVTYTIDALASAPAGITDGTDIPSDYPMGSSLARQNNFTGFGDAAEFSPFTTNGSELNRLFVWNDTSKIYIGIPGNIPGDPGFSNNHLLIFVDSVPQNINGITNQLFTSGQGFNDDPALQGINDFVFDDDFTPDQVIQYSRSNNQHSANIVELEFGLNAPLTFSTDSSLHTNNALSYFSADLSNIVGVNGIRGDDPLRQEELALTAESGVSFSILLSDLGLALNQNVKLAAAVVGGSGFISNQFLPPLNETGGTLMANESAAPAAALSDAMPGDVPDTATFSITPSDAVTQGLSRVTGIEVTINLTHPDVSELAIDLFHPVSDRTVRLWDGNAAGANMNTTFVVGGADLADWTAPGNDQDYEAAESLLTFNDVDPTAGDWVLFITDFVTGNTGTLNSWSLSLREDLGGAIDCIAFIADNPGGVDLGEPPYTGNQFVDVSLPIRLTTPSSFSSQNIPSAFAALAGSERAVQNNYTCFEDSVLTTPANPPGSELDVMFVANTDNRLRVGLTGNLENNRNATILLLDTDDQAGTTTPMGITPPPDALGGNGGNEPGINQLTFDPTFTPDYALTVQTVNAGDNLFSAYLTDLNSNTTRLLGAVVRNADNGTLVAPALPGGNELNQLFVQNDADRLYLGVTGNVELGGFGNSIVIFLDTVDTGDIDPALNETVVGAPAVINGIAGDILDSTFFPEFAVVIDGSSGSHVVTLVRIVNGDGAVVTTLSEDTVIGNDVFALDNSNTAGVTATTSDDLVVGSPPSQQVLNARTADLGVQIALDRDSLTPYAPADGATIEVSAILSGNGGFWSNQTLPGLGGGSANLGDGADLSVIAGDQFASYVMRNGTGGSPYTSPSTFTGSGIRAAMGTASPDNGAIAEQDNYTDFGDQQAVVIDNPLCLQIAFNDSNVFGVTADSAANPTSAESGLEFDIPFADIGIDETTTEVKILAYVAGGFGFLSNQFLPPLGRGDAGNLNGELGISGPVDLSNDAVGNSNQFFVYTLMEALPCGNDPADINGDGVVDITSLDPMLNDIAVFTAVLLDPDSATGCPLQKADVNGVGGINGLDVEALVAALVP